MLRRILVIISAIASITVFANPKTICGNTDDRALSFDQPVGRLSLMEQNYGCTVTLISKSCGISAGHCSSVLQKAEFNTPDSVNREAKPSAPQDVYLIDRKSVQFENQGPGRDWSVMRIRPNTITGHYAGDVQGHYNVSYQKPKNGTMLRITGYGVDRDDADRNFAQQTHTGKLILTEVKYPDTSLMSYTVDTMGGNSGSTIRINETNEIVGIHTHGGCYSYGGSNSGTLISESPKLREAIQNCLASEEN